MRQACIAVVLLAQAGLAATFNDQQRGFSFSLPDGYQHLDEADRSRHAFAREVSPGVEASLLLLLHDKQLAQDLVVERAVTEASMRQGAAAQGTNDLVFEYRTVRWRSFDLEVAVARSAQRATVAFSAPVPLASGLVMVALAGPASEAQRLSTEFDAVVSSMTGPTNWLTVAERAERTGFAFGLASVPFVVVAAVLVALWRRPRRGGLSGR